MKSTQAGVALLALYFSCFAAAQPDPIVRAELLPDSVSVGESLELRVTVLVPTWFTRPPVYPSFELANAITRLPADSSNPLRERVGRENWSGIERRYRIYPLLGASYRLSGQRIGISYAVPGADPIVVDAPVPELEFRAVVPAGAEALEPYLAGRELTFTLRVDGEIDSLATGDALVLEYVAELDGLPALFLPPLAPDMEFDGVSIYAEEATLDDGSPARRRERLTMVFEAGGRFTVPDRTLRYWNMDKESVETVTATGFTVDVIGAPLTASAKDSDSMLRWWPSGLFLLAAAMLVYALRRYWSQLSGWWHDAVRRRRLSERYAFRRLRSLCRTADPHAVYKALLAWIERLAPGMDTRTFAQTFGDTELQQQVAALTARLYGEPPRDLKLRSLERSLVAARARLRDQRHDREHRALPSLNP